MLAIMLVAGAICGACIGWSYERLLVAIGAVFTGAFVALERTSLTTR